MRLPCACMPVPRAAVVDSDVLVLLQSAHVLERPWCLIELATALEQGVPIVGVSLTTGNSPYDFGAASDFLRDLGSQLAVRNPGASEVLQEYLVSIDDLAWQLSVTLPSIISIGFNPSSSKSITGFATTTRYIEAECARRKSTSTRLGEL